MLFKSDLATFVRLYTFLSQVFDYGNTDIEKRFIFFKRLLLLLEFGRERDGVDLSKVVLTHHRVIDQGKRPMSLSSGDKPLIAGATDSGSGAVRDKDKTFLNAIIEKVNDLFQGDLTDDDKLVYVNNVIKGKLMESETLISQAGSNTKEQFSNSPDLNNEILNAIMDALTAHTNMSRQALDSEKVRTGLRDILLGPAKLYESLREVAEERKAS